MTEYIAAYDFGTSGVKIVLFSFDGHVHATHECGYALLHPQENYVEQEPQEYWDAVCTVTRSALAEAGADPASVKALSFSVQAVNLIPVSRDGQVLYRAVSWLDGRAGRQAEEINRRLGAEVVRSQDFQSRLLWFKEVMPDIYENAAYFLDCAGYLQYRATGVMAVADDHPGILRQHPAVQEYLAATMAAAGVGKMSLTVEATKVYGVLDQRGARELGLVEGTPVFGGLIDVPAAAAGAGCVREGDANIYLGSSGWLSVLTRNPTDPAPGSYYLTSIDPELLIFGGCINSCCMSVDWIVNLLYREEKARLGSGVWDVVNQEVGKIPPGCGGLMAAPWLYGEQFPVSDETLRGTFVNASQEHTRGHMAASVMESICMSIRWQLEIYRQGHAARPEFAVANGGGSQSEPWMQMMADILQMPVKIPEQARHSGSLGAAVAAAIGMGLCSYETVEELVHIDRVFYPRAEYAALYQRRFSMFRDLYQALAPFYQKYSGGNTL